MRQLHRTRKSTESTTQLRPYPKPSTTHRLPSRPTSKRLAGLLQLPQDGRTSVVRVPFTPAASWQATDHRLRRPSSQHETTQDCSVLRSHSSHSAAGTLDAWQISKSAWDLSRVCWGPRGDLTLHLAPCLLRSAPRSPTRESGPQPTSGISGEGNPSYPTQLPRVCAGRVDSFRRDWGNCKVDSSRSPDGRGRKRVVFSPSPGRFQAVPVAGCSRADCRSGGFGLVWVVRLSIASIQVVPGRPSW